MTPASFEAGKAAGELEVVPGSEEYGRARQSEVCTDYGREICRERYGGSESLLGREVGGKQNILVMNDEAHHAYRIRQEEADEEEEMSLARRRGRRVL